MAQTTSITREPTLKGLPGLIFDLNDYDNESFVNGAGAPIEFGIGLIRHASNDFEAIPANSGVAGDFLGVAVRRDVYDQATLSGTTLTGTGIPDNEIIEVMTRGRIWVTVERAVTAGAAVFVRTAAEGVRTRLGAFAAADDPDTAGSTFRLSNAKFLTDAGAGELAVLQLSGPCLLTAT